MFTRLAIPDVILVQPRRHADNRGWFTETYNADIWRQFGITSTFVQDNESFSSAAGTIRGLHFQVPPMAQGKLVRCTVGAVFDVAVDLRRGSSTFGHHVAVDLSAEQGNQLYIPEGFAHGYCSILSNSIVEYKVTRPYAPTTERGIAWNDAALDIAWPLFGRTPIVSPRDRELPPISEANLVF